MQIAGANYRSARLVGGGYDATLNPESKIRLEIIYTDLKSEE